MDLKVCNRCKQAQPAPEWHPSQWARSGGWCKSCYQQWHRARYATEFGDDPRVCTACGSSYQPKQRRASAYCSRLCKDNAKNAASAANREASKPLRSCVWCAADMPQRMRSDAKFCSVGCNSAAHQSTRKMWQRLGIPKGDIPLVSRRFLAARDGLGCHLCGLKLTLATKHPEPGYASIDHVRPLAKGGTNDLANLRLAHLVCNLRKRADVHGEQLP